MKSFSVSFYSWCRRTMRRVAALPPSPLPLVAVDCQTFESATCQPAFFWDIKRGRLCSTAISEHWTSNAVRDVLPVNPGQPKRKQNRKLAKHFKAIGLPVKVARIVIDLKLSMRHIRFLLRRLNKGDKMDRTDIVAMRAAIDARTRYRHLKLVRRLWWESLLAAVSYNHSPTNLILKDHHNKTIPPLRHRTGIFRSIGRLIVRRDGIGNPSKTPSQQVSFSPPAQVTALLADVTQSRRACRLYRSICKIGRLPSESETREIAARFGHSMQWVNDAVALFPSLLLGADARIIATIPECASLE